VKGRAETDEAKVAILAEVLEAWRKRPLQRLGQLLVNYLPGARPNAALFYLEDADLARELARRVGVDVAADAFLGDRRDVSPARDVHEDEEEDV
jgi:hypothetical protein